VQRRIGRFEAAEGGTIFLDEVGELPSEAQVSLPPGVAGKRVRAVGSNRPLPVDVRVLAASNRDLKSAVAQGKFREDLYYRLNVFPIEVPRSATEPTTSRCWSSIWSSALHRRLARKSGASREGRWSCFAPTSGPGMSASFKTSSSARSSCLMERRSPWMRHG